MRTDRLFTRFGAALGAATLALLAGCGTVHPAVAELQAVPGATSAYPGSVTVAGHGAAQGEHTLFASSPSLLFTRYCTAVDQSTLTRWFANTLDRAGWRIEADPTGTTDSDVVRTQQWTRGRRTFTLELLSSAYVEKLPSRHGQQCSTGYRTTVQ